MTNIAIIGAGLSGLVLANRLKDRADVTVFEKSRGVSGRMSTRYADAYEFDHGAQYFTARSKAFQRFLAPFIEQGVVAEWSPKTLTLCKGENPYKRDWFEPHYVAVPRMNSLCKKLSENIDVRVQTEISQLSRAAEGWVLETKSGEALNGYDWVISSAPAEQAARLLPPDFSGHSSLSAVKMTGCFSLMLGFAEPLALKFDAAVVKDSPIGWIAVNSSKPGRSAAQSLMIQTTNAWAEEHLEAETTAVQRQLTAEASALLEMNVSSADYASLHRWRYAGVETALEQDFLLDDANQLAACGDWCLSGRVESAFLSADALATALEKRIG